MTAKRTREQNSRYARNYRATHPYRHVKDLYGLSEAAFSSLLAGQGGRCAICGSDDWSKKPCVDHDHVTGTVRGILCRKCNSGIGFLGDDPGLVRAALQYLERK